MKTNILNKIKNTNFPQGIIARELERANTLKGIAYGYSYIQYRNKINKYYKAYDNRDDLLTVVDHAIRTVPYYQSRYLKSPRSIEEFIENMGFIDRNNVVEDKNVFISNEIDYKKYDEVTTGGTSGKPVNLFLPRRRYIFELPTIHSIWNKAGWNFDTRAVIRNHKIPLRYNCLINPITKEYVFDAFRSNEDYLAVIYKIIQKEKIQYIHAYPSAAFRFAKFLVANNLDRGCIKAFLSGSENIYDFQTNLIETQLGVQFFNWYGHSEKLVLGGYCQHTKNYHIEPSYGYFELIDENNNVITEPGKQGEIVGTTLHNFGMPLIRYRTGDFAEYVGSKCPHCGRKLQIIKNIHGRWSGDRIYNKDLSYVTTTALNLHNELYNFIQGLQYIHTEPGKLIIQIIQSSSYGENHERALVKHYKEKFHPDMRIELRYVDKLQVMANGKFLLLLTKDSI